MNAINFSSTCIYYFYLDSLKLLKSITSTHRLHYDITKNIQWHQSATLMSKCDRECAVLYRVNDVSHISFQLLYSMQRTWAKLTITITSVWQDSSSSSFFLKDRIPRSPDYSVTHYAAENNLLILQPPPSKCWDCIDALPCPV